MNGKEEKVGDDFRLDAVLAALATTQPDDGLQRRVLQRLGAEPAHASRLSRARHLLQPRLVLSTAGAAMALFLAAVLFLQHGQHGHSVRHARHTFAELTSAPPLLHLSTNPHDGIAQQRPPSASPQTEGIFPPAPRRDHVAAGTGAPPCASASCELAARQRGPECAWPARELDTPPCQRRVLSNAVASGAAREASFPAPEMPLTEQERLLLQIAHRNDPVQVAMLDPVERSLQQARERAESARFFAPPKLPAELQEEINAALRSQYVNTPPPRELLAQTADPNR